MASLDSLVAARGAVLLVDSASACTQAGLLRPGAEPVWRRSEREAGVAVFECVDAVLREGGLGVQDAGAFVFCEGPGSILSIRTTAMALRAWQSAAAGSPPPAFAYRSLELLAHDLQRAGTTPPFAVIADARRGRWHCAEVSAPTGVSPVRQVAAVALARMAGEIFLPAGFRTWASPPRPARTVAYSVAELWQRNSGADLLRAAPEPDALLYEDPSFAAWAPQIHRAPARSLSQAP